MQQAAIDTLLTFTTGDGLQRRVDSDGLEPCAYLRHVLEHIAAADTVEKIEALLPWSMPKPSAQER